MVQNQQEQNNHHSEDGTLLKKTKPNLNLDTLRMI